MPAVVESETGVLTTGAGNGGTGPGNFGGDIFVQELMRALAIVTPAAKQPPRLEGRSLIKENIRVFLKRIFWISRTYKTGC